VLKSNATTATQKINTGEIHGYERDNSVGVVHVTLPWSLDASALGDDAK